MTIRDRLFWEEKARQSGYCIGPEVDQAEQRRRYALFVFAWGGDTSFERWRAMGMPEDPPSCPHCDEDHAPGKCEFKRGGVVCDWVQLGGD